MAKRRKTKKQKFHLLFPIKYTLPLAVLVLVGMLIFMNNLTASGKGVGGWDAGRWGKKADDQKNMSNISPTPAPILTIQEDSIPPSIKLNFPLDGYVYPTSSIGIRASASDNSGISFVSFYVNGVLKYVDTQPELIPDSTYIPNSVPEPEYYYSWTPPTGKTTYSIEADAYDLAHNKTISTVHISTE